MKFFFLVLFIAVAALPIAVSADDGGRDRCLLATADHLPKTPGVKVASSEIERSQSGAYKIKYVVKFAGQTTVKTYLCASTGTFAPPAVMEVP